MLTFVEHVSRPYIYHAAPRDRRPRSVCKSDFLPCPLHDALMLQHLLHWNGRHGHVLTERNKTRFRQPEINLNGSCSKLTCSFRALTYIYADSGKLTHIQQQILWTEDVQRCNNTTELTYVASFSNAYRGHKK